MSSNSWKRTQTRLRHPEQLEKRAMMSGSKTLIGPEADQRRRQQRGQSDWGAADTDFSRLGLANFADGISSPNGQTLPSAASFRT